MERFRTIGLLGRGGQTACDLARQVRRRAPSVRLIIDDDPSATSADRLAAMAQGLERAGAELLALSDAEAHALLFEVERRVEIPVVSMIEETAAAIALAGGGVALEAGEPGLDLYRVELARRGIAWPLVGRLEIHPLDALATTLADYALGRRSLPPAFSWTEVGPA